jgi:ATP-dependent RNA helicase HelY
MAVNTIENIGFERTNELIGLSFAQFQADSGVTGLAAKLEKQKSGLDGYAEAMGCHLGDFKSYAALREQLNQIEKQASSSNRVLLDQMQSKSMADLKPGDVLMVQAGRKSMPAIVLELSLDFGGDPRALVLNLHREVRRIRASDVAGDVRAVTHIRLPQNFDSRSNKMKSALVHKMKQQAFDIRPVRTKIQRNQDQESLISQIRAEIRSHPCHGCNDREEHARWGERYYKLQREIDSLQNQISARTNVLSKEFTQVSNVLVELGYITAADSSAAVTASGQLLRHLHSENALLLAEGIQQNVFEDLNPAELAAAVSSLVFEPRREEAEAVPRLKSEAAATAIKKLNEIFLGLREIEARNRVNTVTKPELGFSWAIFLWVEGKPLNRILQVADMSAGDFVRTSRRLVDVLEQLASVSNAGVQNSARAAVSAIRRGIVDTEDQPN